MIRHLLPAALLAAAVSSSRAADDPAVTEAAALIGRVVPAHAQQFSCEIIPPENGADVFEIDNAPGKVVLRGNNAVSLASAFNWYLKYTAKCDFSSCGVQLGLPEKLPAVSNRIRHAATVPHRFIYNYCTFGYTMPWWNWQRWERELDWMAMNGINMPFIITGQEAVWINTFTQYGYTEREVRQWLGSPAHFPWTFMQNMHSFGGELPAAWVPQRVKLAQQILTRARALGMKTVLQGYYGMVLPDFVGKHPGAKVIPQGRWAGGLPRPDMLDPTDPMFAKIAATFMAEQEKLFGRAGYYTADPFHEGGNSAGVDMADCGKRTLAAMMARDPDAVWVKMCWQTDNATLLSQIPDDRVIALDLWAENSPFWPRSAFQGKQWVWCLLHNFGGNTDLSTDLTHLARVFPDTLSRPNKGKLVGLGFVPEGYCSSPVVYDLMPEFAWRKDAVEIKPWLADYIARRYGTTCPKATEAWDGILATVGSIKYPSVRETPANSIIQARPLRGEKARTYVHTRPNHDKLRLAKAWLALGAAAPECSASDGYRYDLADITRQVLGDLARPVYERAMQAQAAKNAADFEKHSKLFLKIIADSDAITATRPEFLLGTWIKDARAWGTTPAARDLHEYQARLLITSWNAAPGGDLNDYACRQWAGLLKDYYRGRWELYFTALGDSLRANKPFDQNAFLTKLAAFEKNWVEAKNPYPDKPLGDTLAVARRIAADYAPILSDFYPTPVTPKPADIIGKWEYHAEGGTHLREFLADGTVRALAPNGTPRDWFDGFKWRIEGDRILAEHAGRKMTITHALMKDGTLLFESEGFGRGRRVPSPLKSEK
ncbi:MAG: alpha-N-acetylglucosaminidase [Verrucomicrobia bacterium]|nr:alpha-N-acetylglucosaminidase [Verrucomicrobiota bacterium]